MYTAHKGTCCRIRTEVVARGKGSSGIVHVITFVFGESMEILCRYVKTHIGNIFSKPFVRKVTSQFYVGDFPVCGILNLRELKRSFHAKLALLVA